MKIKPVFIFYIGMVMPVMACNATPLPVTSTPVAFTATITLTPTLTLTPRATLTPTPEPAAN